MYMLLLSALFFFWPSGKICNLQLRLLGFESNASNFSDCNLFVTSCCSPGLESDHEALEFASVTVCFRAVLLSS